MIKDYAELLLGWYRQNARDLPWRHSNDPYRIWISEIMLQQTRAAAVIPYYTRFIAEVPDVFSLNEISDERLMKLWEGLGYYSRARNLKKCAEIIVHEYDGSFPADCNKLRKLPGFGPYTAAAVGAFAFGLDAVPVDGNVFRIFSRFYAIEDDLRKEAVKKQIRELAAQNAVNPPGEYGQALIELGATVCIPGVPDCAKCPLSDGCRALRTGQPEKYPVLSAAKQRKIEHKTVLIILSGNRVLLHKRPGKGLLAGLYEFPSLPGECAGKEEILAFVQKIGFEPLFIKRLSPSKHIFTHIEWHMGAFSVSVGEENTCQIMDYVLASREELQKKYPIPSAFAPWLPDIVKQKDK